MKRLLRKPYAVFGRDSFFFAMRKHAQLKKQANEKPNFFPLYRFTRHPPHRSVRPLLNLGFAATAVATVT